MNKRLLPTALVLATIFILASCHDKHDYGSPTTDLAWHPDILGDGYEARYIPLGDSYDGPIRCTVVRKLSKTPTQKAVLYVHGFNDYFFQKEMGDRFVDSCYNFYAVDLRRYGRSLEPWQYPFDIRNVEDYFADIDSALNIIVADGNTDITLSGHSTGGLTTALYVAERGNQCGVDRLVTDSPFLEWNFNGWMRNLAIPAVNVLGKVLPNVKIDQGHCDGYAYSLLKSHHGRWTYNTQWKMIYSPPVTAGWVSAISVAQSKLMHNCKNITIPVLVMHSSRKVEGCSWTPQFQHGDAVLDPAMIAERGAKLGPNPQVVTIDGGLHDLILSEPEPMEQAYSTIFDFIQTH